jgi:hypothetical protein
MLRHGLPNIGDLFLFNKEPIQKPKTRGGYSHFQIPRSLISFFKATQTLHSLFFVLKCDFNEK